MLKGRSVDGVHSTSNHVTHSIPEKLAGDGLLQSQPHQHHSAVQPPSTTSGSTSSAGRMYLM